MIEQLVSNWICWLIVATAFVCYQKLWAHYLSLRAGTDIDDAKQNMAFTQLLIATLPLLGLLGTITGLLECFSGLAQQGAGGSALSGGIADALLTTQLGLVCAVPGWLLHSYINAYANKCAVTRAVAV